MKNKVLRLAIVAILVVAMILSMAACGPTTPVDPTPTPGTTSPTPAPTTPTPKPTPTVTPPATADEAALAEKYGITFPVKDNMKVDFDTTGLKVVSGKDAVTFGAKAPDYNEAYVAYNDYISVTAKVTGLTAEGAKISYADADLANNDGTPGKANWVKFTPKAAGTYTVVYTVKIAFSMENPIGGLFTPAKVSETYTVTKTYEVAKKEITAEVRSDALVKADKLTFKDATIDFKAGSTVLSVENQIDMIKKELKIFDRTAADYDQKYSLSIDILATDVTAYGTYPLNFVCTAVGKTDKIDVATLVASNFEVTFRNGNRYVLTEAELAASAAAAAAVTAAAATGAKKEEIDLGLSTYNALSAGAKTNFAQNNATAIENMLKNQAELPQIALVAEAKALIKTWNDKLQNAEDRKAFVTYMLGLSSDDYTYVTTALAGNSALEVVEKYLKNTSDSFDAAVEEFMTAVDSFYDEAAGYHFGKTSMDLLTKAQAALEAAYANLTATQKSATVEEMQMTRTEFIGTTTIVTKEMTARYTAYMTLVDGLDAYTGDKATKDEMEKLLGYTFEKKLINNNVSGGASDIIFNLNGTAFTTPILFIKDMTAAYKTMVNAYVQLDAAIVSAQKDVISTLGSKLQYAVKEGHFYSGFNGTALTDHATSANATSKLTGLEALQKYIADKAVEAAIIGTDHLFAQMAKKDLKTLIDASLKECVASVNEYIKDENAFPEAKAVA